MPSIPTREPYFTPRKRQLVLLLFAAFIFLLGPLIDPLTAVVTGRVRYIMDGLQRGEQYENYRKQERIYRVLKESRIELEEAMVVAEVVIKEAKATKIPISLFLAIMKHESNFDVKARSPSNAMGIMQVHPVTWDRYVRKMNLDLIREDAFDPAMNIKVSSAILVDLRDTYWKKGYRDPVLWDYVLSAYYAGSESLKRGMGKNHRKYVARVKRYAGEFGHDI